MALESRPSVLRVQKTAIDVNTELLSAQRRDIARINVARDGKREAKGEGIIC